ncbi:MAG: hypothetical protein AB7T31_13455 [Gemmatimonadales bacterium]
MQLSVRLPRDIAAQAEEVQQSDPEFLSRVVLYGLTRRSIYRHLRDTDSGSEKESGDTLPDSQLVLESEQLRPIP